MAGKGKGEPAKWDIEDAKASIDADVKPQIDFEGLWPEEDGEAEGAFREEGM